MCVYIYIYNIYIYIYIQYVYMYTHILVYCIILSSTVLPSNSVPVANRPIWLTVKSTPGA